jgi:hypothetical protein
MPLIMVNKWRGCPNKMIFGMFRLEYFISACTFTI